MSIRRPALASGLAALALAGSLLAAGTPAFAAGSTASPSASAKAPRDNEVKGICLRAPRIELRVTKAIARINGPVTELGSIAHLQKRVDKAQAAGDTAIATYLNDRLTARKALVGTLTQRQSDLQAVETWCSANNNGAS
ncbi:hypothetical protein [Streptacidiphilus albus]|uniref:hypothetical protein n=1 Tax=Streptacidiphilus albus TaxID=105425 RepID=UPI00054BDFE5|nr:hypothetical protein [Streptacidiphilus albus]